MAAEGAQAKLDRIALENVTRRVNVMEQEREKVIDLVRELSARFDAMEAEVRSMRKTLEEFLQRADAGL